MKTLPFEFSLDCQLKRLIDTIIIIEEESQVGNSDLTLEQVSNAIGHILIATDFDDRDDGSGAFSPVATNIKGAQDIIRWAGTYIGLESLILVNFSHNYAISHGIQLSALWHKLDPREVSHTWMIQKT